MTIKLFNLPVCATERMVYMATSSILKNVVVKDKKSLKKLIGALENAQKKARTPESLSKKASYATHDEIQNMFGGKKD